MARACPRRLRLRALRSVGDPSPRGASPCRHRATHRGGSHARTACRARAGARGLDPRSTHSGSACEAMRCSRSIARVVRETRSPSTRMRAEPGDELGLDPSRPLQQLEEAILQQDASLDLEAKAIAGSKRGRAEPPPPTGAQPERSLLVLAEDEEELDDLLAIAQALASRPRRELIVVRLAVAGARARRGDRGPCRATRRPACPGRRGAHRRLHVAEAGPRHRAACLRAGHGSRPTKAGPALLRTGAIDGEVSAVLSDAPCDVALAAGRGGTESDAEQAHHGARRRRRARMGGRRAGCLGRQRPRRPARSPRCPGDEEAGTADASRLLAHVSLATQRGLGIDCTPMLVLRGDEGVLEAAREASLLVIGVPHRWRQEGLGATRLAVAQRAPVPILIVRRGVAARRPCTAGKPDALYLVAGGGVGASARPCRPARTAARAGTRPTPPASACGWRSSQARRFHDSGSRSQTTPRPSPMVISRRLPSGEKSVSVSRRVREEPGTRPSSLALERTRLEVPERNGAFAAADGEPPPIGAEVEPARRPPVPRSVELQDQRAGPGVPEAHDRLQALGREDRPRWGSPPRRARRRDPPSRS